MLARGTDWLWVALTVAVARRWLRRKGNSAVLAGLARDLLRWMESDVDPAEVLHAADLLQSADSDDQGLDDRAAILLYGVADWMEVRAAKDLLS